MDTIEEVEIKKANRARKRKERTSMGDLVYLQIKIHPSRRESIRAMESKFRKPVKGYEVAS